MKNRFKLIIAFMLALAISGGVYAYAYTTATETVNIAEPTGDIATSNKTETQPDWESILDYEIETETLRPDGAGDETVINFQFPASGEHWDKVDEETSDGDSTYVYHDEDKIWGEDLYNIDDHVVGWGDINYVEVYMVGKVEIVGQTAAYVHIKTEGGEHNGTEETMTTSYATYSYQWNTNPQTSDNWTWDEIDALQMGVGLLEPAKNEYVRCTQVYADVNYGGIPLSGNVLTGDLFEITPHPDYTADLAVKVYLTNTGNLTKAYQYLNMELYLENSVEAGEIPDYRLLTLENGVATFSLESVSDNCTLSVTGGSYCLLSKDPEQWDTGWMVTPEFYCEVTQR